MPDKETFHQFYEANLPGYSRKDIIEVTRFFTELLGWKKAKPLESAGSQWKRFKEFVCVDWMGQAIQSNKKAPEAVKAEPEFGRCSCGGKWVKRQNSQKKNFFLGCSRYPKCKNTQNL